jgi:hypothetical protein
MKRFAFLVLLVIPLLLAWGGPTPPPRLVMIPYFGVLQPEAGVMLDVCLDSAPSNGSWSASTKPVLYSFQGRARLGPVTAGTCAWIDGYSAQSAVQLACETPGLPKWLGPVAIESTAAGPTMQWSVIKARCAAAGGVPPSQDFRY